MLLLFMIGWLPPSVDKRRFTLLGVGLIILAFLIAEAGRILLGWELPWQIQGVIVAPPSTFDLIALPSLACLGLMVWFGFSTLGMGAINPRIRFNVWRALLLAIACLLYLIGMIWFKWPAPWHLPIPSE